MNCTIAGFFVFVVLVGGDLFGTESRVHYLIADRNRKPQYEVTEIHHDGRPAMVTRTYLIADPDGPLLRIDLIEDYANRQNLATYTLMRASHDNARIVQDLPYTATTMEGRVEEFRKHPELDAAPVPVSIEAASGRSVRGTHSDWARADAVGDANRERTKDAIGATLVAALDGIRELAGLRPFADINPFFIYIFDEGKLVRRSLNLMVATVKRDCAFDASFNVPCPQ